MLTSFTTDMNISSINAAYIDGIVGINTSTELASTITVYGNVYASNSLYGNITGYLANVTTLNISYIYGTSGSVGFNTGSSGAALKVEGNTYTSNALSAQNIAVTTSLYYAEDLTRRSPHLKPSYANASAIQNWITASCNVTQKVGWSASAGPVYSNIVSGAKGQSDYSGSILLANGRVLFVPYNSSNIGVFNPANIQFSTVVPSVALGGPFSSGILLPTGNVLFFSTTKTIGMYNPSSFGFSTISVPSAGNGNLMGVLTANNVLIASYSILNYNFNTGVITTQLNDSLYAGSGGNVSGTCLLPNGNVIISSSTNQYVTQFDPVSLQYSNIFIGNDGSNTLTLAPNGNVIGTPVTSNIIIINPSASVSSNVSTGAAFSGGVLLPTGNILFMSETSNGGMFDPSTLGYSNLPQVTGSFSSGKLTPRGQVIFTPYNSANVGVLDTMTPISREFCLSPYFNKF